MDCRKSLVLALGLVGVVGCVPDSQVVNGPAQPPPGAVVEKLKDPPKRQPTAATCVAAFSVDATSAAGNETARACGVSKAVKPRTDRDTPRRASRAANRRRPRASRPDRVPSFQPSCPAASLRPFPSRSHRTIGRR